MKKVSLSLSLATLLAGILVLTSCATMGTADAGQFASAVKSTWDAYGAALIAADADRWISLWDENGVQLPPESPAVNGKTAILQAVRGGLQEVRFEKFTINLEETQVSGHLGFARGTYSYAATPKATGTTVSFQGKYLTIFKKQPDGSWKIYRDCFNSSSPPQ